MIESIIASRWFESSDPTKSLTISITRPQKTESGDWACRIVSEGAREKTVLMYGVDSVQCLELAIRHIDAEVEVARQLLGIEFYFAGVQVSFLGGCREETS
jgi:hypothetical protein